ncbi:MAG: NAD(P)/FAD-dependent oxidoreductase, partial [Deltaproteobacteria bacterium]|nr:NAD(P)/FAD-dependent oxidoreductase [Deltaproteobacteria bacterium]
TTKNHGIEVDDTMQKPGNPAVYAAGDVADTPFQLTPVSAMEGKVAARNILGLGPARADYSSVAFGVFTSPPLASVGKGEKKLKDEGIRYKTHYHDMSGWFSSRRMNFKRAAAKVLEEEDTGRILGAHLYGPNVDEAINLFALAVRYKLSAGDLKSMPFAYPTVGSDIGYMV